MNFLSIGEKGWFGKLNFIRKYSLLIAMIFLLISIIFTDKAVGIVLSLLSLAVLLCQPKSGLLFLFIYFPIRPFFIEVNDGLKYLGDLLIVGLFIYVIVSNIKNDKTFKESYLIVIGFLGFCFIGVISSLLTGVEFTSIIFQLRAFLLTFLLIFIIKGLEVQRNDVYSFLLTTVLVAAFISVHGIIEKVSNRTLLLPDAWKTMQLSETNQIRIYGLIGNPNVLAMYLVIAFFLSFYLKKCSRRFQLLWSSFSILFFGVFLLTYSRGTIIGLIIGLIIYLILTKNWKMLKSAAICGILAVPLVYYPVLGVTDYFKENIETGVLHSQGDTAGLHNGVKAGDFSKRMSESFDAQTVEQSKNWGRLYVVQKGLEIFKNHPFIGTGFGTYGDSASLVYPSPITKQYNLLPHLYSDNQYIQVIVQTGLIGVLFFTLFIIGVVNSLWKKKNVHIFSLPLLAIMVGGVTVGFVYNIWEDKTFTLYFYSFLGFVLNNDIQDKSRETAIKVI